MKQIGGIVLQERDIRILQGLFESRVMTGAHIATLYFDDRKEASKKRIQKLKRARLVTSKKAGSMAPTTYSISSDGITALHRFGALHNYPALSARDASRRSSVSQSTIAHELEVMDVKTAFISNARQSENLTIPKFCTWPKLIQFESRTREGRRNTVKPDGFLVLNRSGSEIDRFFLEVDRSTETLDTLVRKAESYLYHYRSGNFAKALSQPESEYKRFPFRVLFVVKSQERQSNLHHRLLAARPPILTQALVATSEEVLRDPFGAIWHRPADIRDSNQDHPPKGISPI